MNDTNGSVIIKFNFQDLISKKNYCKEELKNTNKKLKKNSSRKIPEMHSK